MVSLRYKIFIAFVLLVVSGTALSTLIGSRIITRALLAEAQKRALHGLEAAKMVYDGNLARTQRRVVRAARNERLVAAIVRQRLEEAQANLRAELNKERFLDFLSFVDRRGEIAVHGKGDRAGRSAARIVKRGLIQTALEGISVEGTDVFSSEELVEENKELAQRFSYSLRERKEGLVLIAASPLIFEEKLLGVIYGGYLLNNEIELVGQMHDHVFGPQEHEDHASAFVSLFLQDVLVATTLLPSPVQASGRSYRLTNDVAQRTLGQGQHWFGKTQIMNSVYVTACVPLQSVSGKNIGVLSVGLLERSFLAARTEMMLTFLAVAVFGVLIVLGLTYMITRSMVHPLEEMATGTKQIAAGDLNYRVPVRSRDEIGQLALSFNQMLDSLQTMKSELQEWGHTLEGKVKERTAELEAVQAGMVQSEKLASLGRMAAAVAHEINNPLGGILSFAMLGIEECDEKNPLKEKLDLISKQALRCRKIVRDLLDFSRRDAEPSVVLTNVNTIVDQTLSLVSRQSILLNIKTVLNLRADLPPVAVDAGQLQQVLLNLILNAADAMDGNGILTIETSVDEEANEVLLAIGDTGRGIPKEIMPFIFEPFFTTKKTGQGTGLGLSIVNAIVTRVRGRIEVATSASSTTFTVHLPQSLPQQ